MIVVRANQSQQDTSAAVAPIADVEVVAGLPSWQATIICIYTWSAKHTTVHCLSSRLRTPSVSSWHHVSRQWCSTSTTRFSSSILQAFAARRRKNMVDDKCYSFHMSSTTTGRSIEEPWPSSWQQLLLYICSEALRQHINSPCGQRQRPHPWAKTASPETINTSGYVSGTLQMIASILRRGIHRLPKDGNSFWLFPNLHKPNKYIYIERERERYNDQDQHFASWADIVSIGSCMHIMQCKKNYL